MDIIESKLGVKMQKQTAVKLLAEVAESYPNSFWVNEEAVRTFELDSKGVYFGTTFTLIDGPDGILAMTALRFPEPMVVHKKFLKGIKLFQKSLKREKSMHITFSNDTLGIIRGATDEGITVELLREMGDDTFETANAAFSRMIEFLDK
jgi:hypothetical protein